MNSEIEMQDLLVGIHQQLTEVRKALKDEQDRTEAILSRISEVNLRVSVACFSLGQPIAIAEKQLAKLM